MSARPSITFLTTRFWPDQYGGVETHMLGMARGMAQKGCDVHVLTENRTGAPQRESLGDHLHVDPFLS